MRFHEPFRLFRPLCLWLPTDGTLVRIGLVMVDVLQQTAEVEAVATLGRKQGAAQHELVQTNDALGGVFEHRQGHVLAASGSRLNVRRGRRSRCETRRASRVDGAMPRPSTRLNVAPAPHSQSHIDAEIKNSTSHTHTLSQIEIQFGTRRVHSEGTLDASNRSCCERSDFVCVL